MKPNIVKCKLCDGTFISGEALAHLYRVHYKELVAEYRKSESLWAK